jgi:hypothetical protein
MKGDEPASRGWWLRKIRTIHDRMSHPGITGISGNKNQPFFVTAWGEEGLRRKPGGMKAF